MDKTISRSPRIVLFDTAEGRNGANNLFRVRLWAGAARPAAVLAQEIFEMEYKRGRFLRWFVARIVPGWRRRFDEEMELIGHAVEIEAAIHLYVADRSFMETHEARSLTAFGSSYARRGMFKGLSISDVRLSLRARRVTAARWLRENSERLAGWKSLIEENADV